MKTSQALYAIIALFMTLVLSIVLLPVGAQYDWLEACQMPGLEASLNAANDAQTNGDVAAFVNHMAEINRLVDDALLDCVVAAAGNRVDLAGADLSGADLEEASFRDANLEGANLRRANLMRVEFRRANLQGANLGYANLQEAGMIYANLQGANLTGARLQGTHLTESNLRGANFSRATFDETTTLPDAIRDQTMGLEYIAGFWAPDTDMARYTDPAHPDFWDPCVEAEIPPQYCVASDR